MFDTNAIREQTNLIQIIESGTTLTKVADTDGGEYAGPCPKCGGRDRFHCTAQWWFCRQCHPKRGDAIEFIRWRDEVSFVDACQMLGGAATASPPGPAARKSRQNAPPPPPSIIVPADGWQVRAQRFVDASQQYLLSDKTPEALQYLLQRGLTIETIRKARLGYYPNELFMDPAQWGLAEGESKVWIPRGWVIPCEQAGVIQYIKIRRTNADLAAAEAWNKAHPKAKRQKPTAKYLAIKGSQKRGVVYGLDHAHGHTDLILTEGEFNTLVLRQALGDVCAVVSVGDAGNRPGQEALAVMAGARRWFLAFDMDAAGSAGQSRLAEEYRRAVALEWRQLFDDDKADLNDAYVNGVDLAERIIPLIGPQSPEGRRLWAIHHLANLTGDETEPDRPVARLRRALEAERGEPDAVPSAELLEPDVCAEPPPPAPVLATNLGTSDPYSYRLTGQDPEVLATLSPQERDFWGVDANGHVVDDDEHAVATEGQQRTVPAAFTPRFALEPVRYACIYRHTNLWQRPDGGWVCDVCHPQPSRLLAGA
jgi:hypothetical protein